MKQEDWIIEVENLCYTYDGNDERALDGMDLKIRRGRKGAFRGGNGAGQQTFFLGLNGIGGPEDGRTRTAGGPGR